MSGIKVRDRLETSINTWLLQNNISKIIIIIAILMIIFSIFLGIHCLVLYIYLSYFIRMNILGRRYYQCVADEKSKADNH
jgi:membrane-bound ClpP family serine protease